MKQQYAILRHSLIFLFVIFLSSCVKEDDPSPVSLSAGDRCPAFSVTLSDGTAVTTSDLAGRTTLLLFFDTTCPDCRNLLPVVEQVYKTIGSPTFSHTPVVGAGGSVDTPVDAEVTGEPLSSYMVLAISRAQSATAVLEYWKTNAFTIPVSPQPDSAVYNLFANTVIPRIYIVSPSLTITHTFADSPLPTVSALLSAMGAKEQ